MKITDKMRIDFISKQLAAKDARIAELEAEKNKLILAVGEHVTKRAEYQERVSDLSARLEEQEEMRLAAAQAQGKP